MGVLCVSKCVSGMGGCPALVDEMLVSPVACTFGADEAQMAHTVCIWRMALMA